VRIASLLPSATEIVYALGLGDQLVAVTHECDFPPQAREKTAVTRSLLPSGLPSARIDRAVREGRRDAHTIYELDAAGLVSLEPDVVLTQSLCDVCAVPRVAVEEAACSMPRQARVVSLDPHTLEEMIESILVAGAALDAPDAARTLVRRLRERLGRVSAAIGRTAGPRVFCCEWLDPLFRGGHWVPEQVRLAGGEDALGRPGLASTVVGWRALAESAPEVVVLMPCGFDAAEAARRLDELAGRPEWQALPAVRTGHVFAVDGSAYFSRPGPRLVDGVQLLARILHPELIEEPAPEGAVLRLEGRPAAFVPYR
jgi:iron complex transport system substrate-binding protein